MNNIEYFDYFPPNFEGLVLGRIDAIRDATSVVRGAFADFAFRIVVFLSAGIVLVFRSAVSPSVLDSRQCSLVFDFNFCSTLVILSAPSSLLMRSGAC